MALANASQAMCQLAAFDLNFGSRGESETELGRDRIVISVDNLEL
jgi:hypothetical protein